MANNRDLNIRLNADSTGFERGFKSAAASAKVFERELAKVEQAQRDMAKQEAAAYRDHERMVKEANDATAQIGTAIGIGSAAIIAGLGKAVMTAADFDAAMSSVQAATGESENSMGKLRDAAIKAGADTVYSATEAAGAIEELAKAGVSTEDILSGGLAGALNLAAAGGIEVADAAEAAASAMVQFGLSGAQVPHVADVLAAAAGKAQGGVSDMNYALAQSGTVASQFGLTIEQTTGTLAAFASSGLMGSDAGTSFKTMLLALANPSEKAANLMAELGINAYDAQGKFVGVAQLAGQLQTALGGLTQEQRNAALATIFGSDAMRAAAILYKEGGQGIEDWTAAVNDSGYAAEVAETKLDNLKGDLEALQGSLQTLLINLGGNKIGDAARTAAQELDHLIDAFNSMPEFVQSDIQVLGALAGGLGLLVSAAMIAVPKWDEFKDVMTRNARATNLATTAIRRYGTVTLATMATVGAAILGTQIADHLNTASAEADQTTNALMAIATGAEVAGSAFDRFDGKALGILTQNVTDADMAVKVFGSTAAHATQGGLRGFTDAVLSLGGNERQFNSMVKDLDASLADMVQNGHADEAKAALDRLLESVGAQGGDVDETRGKFKLYDAALDSTAAAAANARQEVKFFSDAQGEATGIAQELTEAQAELRDEMVKGINSFLSPLGAYNEALEEKQDAERESAEATAKATKDGKDSWEDYAKDVKLSVQEYIDSLQEQIDAQNNWSTNLLALSARGLPNEILQQLVQMGEEGAPIVQKFVDATNAEFNKLVETWPRAAGAGADAVADKLNNAGPVLKQIAEASGQAIARGYAEKLAAGTMGIQDVILDYRNLLVQNIPPEATTEIVVDGVPVSRDRILEIKRTMDRYLQDKTITITAAIRAATSALSGTGTRVAQGQGGGGGQVLATGGPVWGPGGPTDDAIPAWLSNGEYVINARQTAKHRALLEQINAGAPGFATGGPVGSQVAISLPDPYRIRTGLNDQLAPLVAGVQRAADAAADAADSAALAGGTAAAGGQGMGWQWQIATLRKAFPGLALNSGYRPGSKTVSGNTSYHARGRAVDVPPRMEVFRWLLANYGNSPEIIFSPAGGSQIKNGRPHFYTGAVRAMHFNHVHWAYDQGGIARGMGLMPKMVNAPERVLSPAMTKDFERLVDFLHAAQFADGGIVSRGTRTAQNSGQAISSATVPGTARSGSLVAGQDPVTGAITFRNGFDVEKYLARMMQPVKLTIDDSELRNANMALAQWTGQLAMADMRLNKAKLSAEAWDDELRNATNDLDTANRNVENSTDDVARAQKQLADSQKDLSRINAKDKANAERLADARERVAEDTADLNKATSELKAAQADVTNQTNRLTTAQVENGKAQAELNEATAVQASVSRTAADATERQAEAERKLNEAKAAALAYAQQIAAAATARAEVTGLFTEEDAARALKYAEAAYGASVAEGQAAKDATEYQAKIDQLAAAGQKLAAAQAAMGASYSTQKATIAGTRAEVERLALSYGFTAQQARDLAESAVPLANSGQTLVDSLTRQLTAVQEFSQSVTTLKALGLSQGLIEQILAAGPEKGLQVAQEIISGGTDMVRKLNDVQAKLVAASNALGQSAATGKYGDTSAPTNVGLVPMPTVSTAPVISRGTRTPAAAGAGILAGTPRPIIAHAGGGLVSGPGSGISDSIPAYLSNGEYVIKAAAVAKYGDAFFDSVNAMRYAAGGLVSRATPAAGRPAQPYVIQVAAGATGPQFHAPLFDNVTVRETVDADVLWARAPLALGPLGLGGGRG